LVTLNLDILVFDNWRLVGLRLETKKVEALLATRSVTANLFSLKFSSANFSLLATVIVEVAADY